MKAVAPLLSRLRHPLARHRARHVARARQAHNQILAWRVQDCLAELGLTHQDYSIAGGRMVRIPEVLTVSTGPPVGLVIRMLPGQRADDFTAHASTIASYLGVAKIRVIPLEHPLIRLELLPPWQPSSS